MYGLHANAACGCKAGASLWIEVWFGDCVYSTWEMVSFYIGLSSLMFWLVAQVPQFISNWRLQSADALSPWFLLQWLAVSTPLPFAVSSLGFWNWSDALRQTYDLHGIHCSRVISSLKVEGMGSASLPLVPSPPGYICHCNAKAQIRNCLQQSSGEHPCGESAVLGCNREQSMDS